MTDDVNTAATPDLSLLTAPEERDLMTLIADLPETIIMAEAKMDPSRITHYAIDLASAFHTFYNACRVRVDDADLMHARVTLITAAKQVLKNVLTILGVDAPDRM